MKNQFRLFLFFAILVTLSLSSPANETHPFYNVKDYGAAGDGKNIDSKAINATIEAASSAGGGTVYIPAGNYLSGSIRLKSNITLYIEQGATIIAAPISAENGYDEEEESISTKYQDSGHSHWKNSLIWGYDIQNISIVGAGWINGKNLYKDWVKDSRQNANKAISLYRCSSVTMRDITIIHGGWFAILATGVNNLTLENLKIDTNRDGIDIDCCHNVHISNCSVNSPFDDGICLKSTFALGFACATENVTINNCLVSGYDEGSMVDGTFTRNQKEGFGDPYPTGRIKFGTESNGGFKNITITNCVFDYCRGFALETVDGGFLEDIAITNITMRNICNSPIFLRLGARMRGPENILIGKLHRIFINNIIAYNVDPAQGILISGIPGNYIEDIELKDIKIFYKGGGTKEQGFAEVPLKENAYPEPSMFGVIPAYGIYVRYVKGINFENIDIHYEGVEKRPAIMFDQVSVATLRFVRAMKDPEIPSLVLKHSEEIHIFESLNLKNQLVDKVSRKEF